MALLLLLLMLTIRMTKRAGRHTGRTMWKIRASGWVYGAGLTLALDVITEYLHAYTRKTVRIPWWLLPVDLAASALYVVALALLMAATAGAGPMQLLRRGHPDNDDNRLAWNGSG